MADPIIGKISVGDGATFTPHVSSQGVLSWTNNKNLENPASVNIMQEAMNLYAPIASPAFTGAPTAPTPNANDNSTKLATTAFVQTAVGGISWSQVTGKPTFAAVATSGSYNDLSNKPAIPTVPTDISAFTNDAGYITSVSWNQVTGKPTFATVATSGSYSDLSGKPTIPTVPSAMTAAEASTGTSTTARTITAKVLSDLIDEKISAITDGDGVSY